MNRADLIREIKNAAMLFHLVVATDGRPNSHVDSLNFLNVVDRHLSCDGVLYFTVSVSTFSYSGRFILRTSRYRKKWNPWLEILVDGSKLLLIWNSLPNGALVAHLKYIPSLPNELQWFFGVKSGSVLMPTVADQFPTNVVASHS